MMDALLPTIKSYRGVKMTVLVLCIILVCIIRSLYHQYFQYRNTILID